MIASLGPVFGWGPRRVFPHPVPCPGSTHPPDPMSDTSPDTLGLDALVPHRSKALAVGRFHRDVLRRRLEAIRVLCGAAQGARALEMFWIVQSAVVAALDDEDVSQKQLAARVAGSISVSTISRTVQDAEQLGWVQTRPSARDQRIRMIAPSDRATAFFLDPARLAAEWADCQAVLSDLRDQTVRAYPDTGTRLDAWFAALARLTDLDRARITGRLQLTAFDRLLRILVDARGGPDFVRGHEAFWIVLETIVTAVEGGVLTQKDLAARAAGLYSAATLSRVVRNAVARGWVVSRAGHDGRTRMLEPTSRALEYFFSERQVDSGWHDYVGIFLRAAPTS